MERKIAFFDIDGTLTSETDGSIPESAVAGIRRAREKGHLMFINTGRCFQNVEPRFRQVGFDGYVCGCGLNIYCDGQELLYVPMPRPVKEEMLALARSTGVEILFESRTGVAYDLSRPLRNERAIQLYQCFVERGYDLSIKPEQPDFVADKFVIWFREPGQLEAFRKTSDRYFDCIHRGGCFREFVPHGYSKATGLQFVLDHYGMSLEDAYGFGDSNNDLTMLQYLKNSVVMGNAESRELMDCATFVTRAASRGGLSYALEQLGFF